MSIRFKVYNVQGDGHCMYRCIWKIAKSDEEMFDIFCLDDSDNELQGALKIRSFVAMSIRFDKRSQDILANLICLYKDVPEILQNYPILQNVDLDADLMTNFENVAKMIQNTHVYASSLELDIIRNRFTSLLAYPFIDIDILVVSHVSKSASAKNDKADLADKWLRELHQMLKFVTSSRVAVLVNEDNFHYRFAKIGNHPIIDKDYFRDYLSSLMESDSEDDD